MTVCREVFLVYQYTAEAPVLGLGHFVDDFLLDFDIYHVSHASELQLHIDSKQPFLLNWRKVA